MDWQWLLIPSGPLRENLISLNKYNVLIKQDMDNNINENIADKIKEINPQIRIFYTYYKPKISKILIYQKSF